jgi:hypothetical protein
MKTILWLCLLSLPVLAQSVFPQTNPPVVIVKPFRDPAAKSIVKLTGKSGPHDLKCTVKAVYKNYLKLWVEETDGRDDGKIIGIKMDEFGNYAVGNTMTITAEKIGTIQAVNEDGTPAAGAVFELWEKYDDTAEQQEIERSHQKFEAEKRADLIKKQEAAIARKKTVETIALKSNQAAADKGDAYVLLRMGERYRDGDGVETNLAKAKEYLQKAADAGSQTAKDELSKLNQP